MATDESKVTLTLDDHDATRFEDEKNAGFRQRIRVQAMRMSMNTGGRTVYIETVTGFTLDAVTVALRDAAGAS